MCTLLVTQICLFHFSCKGRIPFARASLLRDINRNSNKLFPFDPIALSNLKTYRVLAVLSAIGLKMAKNIVVLTLKIAS